MQEGRKTYFGERTNPDEKTASDTKVIVVTAKGKYELPLAPSLKIRNHSPTGFSWGYNGSGPAQLALAIMLDHFDDDGTALQFYQQFKDEYVARWGEVWAITANDIDMWADSVSPVN